MKLLYSSNTGDTALFLLTFPKGIVKLQDLKRTKSLFNVIIGWRHYIRKRSETVQCFRCQQFGHGMKNCNLQPKCVKCGEFHLSRECQLPKKSQSHSTDSGDTSSTKVRCANCSQNHTASYKGCPSRLRYIKSLEEKKSGPSGRATQSNKAAEHRNRVVIRPQNRGQSSLIQSGLSFANVAANTASAHSDVPNDSERFSLEEFLSLAQELFARLSNCQSKASQFLAISELMIKYVYNG